MFKRPQHVIRRPVGNTYKISVILLNATVSTTGGRLNKKDGLTRYDDSHVKDKTS